LSKKFVFFDSELSNSTFFKMKSVAISSIEKTQTRFSLKVFKLAYCGWLTRIRWEYCIKCLSRVHVWTIWAMQSMSVNYLQWQISRSFCQGSRWARFWILWYLSTSVFYSNTALWEFRGFLSSLSASRLDVRWILSFSPMGDQSL